MQLCQIVIVGQTSITPSFQNYIPTLSSLVVISYSISSPKKEQRGKEDITKKVIKEEKSLEKQDYSKENFSKVDTPKVKILESILVKTSPAKSPSLSKVNACLDDDWDSLDFIDSHVGE